MAAKKPNWTPLQLFGKIIRAEELWHETKSHDRCSCNLCMELFSIDTLLETFSEDEKAGAVIEYNKSLEVTV